MSRAPENKRLIYFPNFTLKKFRFGLFVVDTEDELAQRDVFAAAVYQSRECVDEALDFLFYQAQRQDKAGLARVQCLCADFRNYHIACSEAEGRRNSSRTSSLSENTTSLNIVAGDCSSSREILKNSSNINRLIDPASVENGFFIANLERVYEKTALAILKDVVLEKLRHMSGPLQGLVQLESATLRRFEKQFPLSFGTKKKISSSEGSRGNPLVRLW